MQDTIYLYYSIPHGYSIFIHWLPVITCAAESNFSCSHSNKPSECIFYLSRLDTFSNIEISVISLRKYYIATIVTSQYNPNDKVIFSDHLNTALYFFNETKHYWCMHSICLRCYTRKSSICRSTYSVICSAWKFFLMLASHFRIVAFFLFHHIHYELSTIRTLVLKNHVRIYFESHSFSIYIGMFEQTKNQR